MEIIQFLPPTRKPFSIAVIGDIQWNGDNKEIWGEGLKQYIDLALSHNAYFVGHGDYIDFASPSSRHRLLSSGAYSGPMQKLDDIALELTHQVYEKFLKPTKGRWVTMLEGHHFWQFKDGTTSDMRLCEMLGAVHGGTECIVEWGIPHTSRKQCIETKFQTWHHHGWGGGEESSLILKLKKVAADWDGVSAFFMGHMTKMATTFIPKLTAYTGQMPHVHERRVALVGTGGWAKGKIVGLRDGKVPRGNYIEQRGMRPVSLGAPIIHVKRTRQRQVSGENNSHRSRVELAVLLQ